ncbi:hypothetical protein CEXT_563391 [Caerostris extrusa]|uniref:Uncharacterized protein n=1 Tax=Caerostris extrusa TaxID=172846 RepID=A0AAV4XFD7_CAEEX|nr:hypothetical protein CEXT_563391 [Caerostris extrusa]
MKDFKCSPAKNLLGKSEYVICQLLHVSLHPWVSLSTLSPNQKQRCSSSINLPEPDGLLLLQIRRSSNLSILGSLFPF